MTFQTDRAYTSTSELTGAETLTAWRDALSPVIETLQRMAGTTENEFLEIGSQMQSLYQRSAEISGISNRLM